MIIRRAKKYTDEEIFRIIANDETPIFVAVDEEEEVLDMQLDAMTRPQKNNRPKACNLSGYF